MSEEANCHTVEQSLTQLVAAINTARQAFVKKLQQDSQKDIDQLETLEHDYKGMLQDISHLRSLLEVQDSKDLIQQYTVSSCLNNYLFDSFFPKCGFTRLCIFLNTASHQTFVTRWLVAMRFIVGGNFLSSGMSECEAQSIRISRIQVDKDVRASPVAADAATVEIAKHAAGVPSHTGAGCEQRSDFTWCVSTESSSVVKVFQSFLCHSLLPANSIKHLFVFSSVLAGNSLKDTSQSLPPSPKHVTKPAAHQQVTFLQRKSCSHFTFGLGLLGENTQRKVRARRTCGQTTRTGRPRYISFLFPFCRAPKNTIPTEKVLGIGDQLRICWHQNLLLIRVNKQRALDTLNRCRSGNSAVVTKTTRQVRRLHKAFQAGVFHRRVLQLIQQHSKGSALRSVWLRVPSFQAAALSLKLQQPNPRGHTL